MLHCWQCSHSQLTAFSHILNDSARFQPLRFLRPMFLGRWTGWRSLRGVCLWASAVPDQLTSLSQNWLSRTTWVSHPMYETMVRDVHSHTHILSKSCAYYTHEYSEQRCVWNLHLLLLSMRLSNPTLSSLNYLPNTHTSHTLPVCL